MKIDTKTMVRSSVIGSFLYVVYISFSNILYLELLTTMLLTFSQIVSRRVIINASILFSILVNVLNGPQIWHLMYLFIYPFYASIFSENKAKFEKHEKVIPFVGAICSGIVGIVLDIPFLLFGKYVTIYYLLSSIKTSVIQGTLTYLSLMLLYKPMKKIFIKIVQ